MQGIRHEDRYHTDEQIREAVAFAVECADDEAIPSDLREAAFTFAVNCRVQKNITIEAIQPGVPRMAIPRR